MDSPLNTFHNIHSPEQHGRPGLVAEAGPGGVGGLGRAHGSLHVLGHGVGQVGVHAARGGVHAGGEETIQYTEERGIYLLPFNDIVRTCVLGFHKFTANEILQNNHHFPSTGVSCLWQQQNPE